MTASYLTEARLPVLRQAAKDTAERGAYWPPSYGANADVAFQLIGAGLLAYKGRALVVTEAGLAELARVAA